jgi:hypothetical protein
VTTPTLPPPNAFAGGSLPTPSVSTPMTLLPTHWHQGVVPIASSFTQKSHPPNTFARGPSPIATMSHDDLPLPTLWHEGLHNTFCIYTKITVAKHLCKRVFVTSLVNHNDTAPPTHQQEGLRQQLWQISTTWLCQWFESFYQHLQHQHLS